MDPFQVECRLTPPGSVGSALSEVILPKSSQILSKLSVDRPPPQDQHCQRWSFQSLRMDPFQVECRSTPSPDPLPQRRSFLRNDGSFPSWVSIDPPSPPSPPKKLRNDNFQVECRLTPPPLPKNLRNDNFQVECQLTPPPLPPHLRNDNFQVECRSTPPPLPSPPKKWQLPSWVSIDPPCVLIRGQSTACEQILHIPTQWYYGESPCRFITSTYLIYHLDLAFTLLYLL